MIRTMARRAGVAAALAAACALTVGTSASAEPSGPADVVTLPFTADSGECRLGVTRGTLSFAVPAQGRVGVTGEVLDRRGSSTGRCLEDRRKTVATFTALSRGVRVDVSVQQVDNGRLDFADVLASVDEPQQRPIDTVRIDVCRHRVTGVPEPVCGTPVFIRAPR